MVTYFTLRIGGTVNATLEQVIGISKILLIFVVTMHVMAPAKLVKQLAAQWIAAESFQPYGQVIHATIDQTYDSTDAHLVLQNGIPRFYIMRLQHRGYKFDTLMCHVQCT